MVGTVEARKTVGMWHLVACFAGAIGHLKSTLPMCAHNIIILLFLAQLVSILISDVCRSR